MPHSPTRRTLQRGMQVSFVIPLYNCLAHTRECVRTLRATIPRGIQHEFILVDDGSTDGTREWLGQNPDIHAILNATNLGFAGSCNHGAARAKGDVLFFLNNDLVLIDGWFEPMYDLVRRRSEAALVGNVQLRAATGELDHAGVAFNYKAKPEHDLRRPWFARLRGFREVPAVTGACFAIRRAVWRDLGGFDEQYRNGGEDIDLCLRARAAGYRNFVSLRSVVLHHVSQSTGRKKSDEQNSRRLAEKWRGELALLSARAWAGYHLETAWHGTRDPDGYAAAIHMLLESMGLMRKPCLATVCGADRAIEIEMQRWREILDGANRPPVDTTVRTAEI